MTLPPKCKPQGTNDYIWHSDLHQVTSVQVKLLAVSRRRTGFSMRLDTARWAEWKIQVVKWDFPQQRLPTVPAPPGGGEEHSTTCRVAVFDTRNASCALSDAAVLTWCLIGRLRPRLLVVPTSSLQPEPSKILKRRFWTSKTVGMKNLKSRQTCSKTHLFTVSQRRKPPFFLSLQLLLLLFFPLFSLLLFFQCILGFFLLKLLCFHLFGQWSWDLQWSKWVKTTVKTACTFEETQAACLRFTWAFL